MVVVAVVAPDAEDRSKSAYRTWGAVRQGGSVY